MSEYRDEQVVKLREYKKLAGRLSPVEQLVLDLADENAALKRVQGAAQAFYDAWLDEKPLAVKANALLTALLEASHE